MDVERSIVSVVASGQRIDALLAKNIEPHHFRDPDCQEVYAWMIRHQRDHSALPSTTLARARWPKFEWIDVSDTLEAVADEMVALVNWRAGVETVRDLSEILDDRSRRVDAGQLFLERVRQFNVEIPTTSVTRYSDSLNRLALYRAKQAAGGATPGISMVLPEFDDLTYGILPGDSIVIQGFTNIGKSTLAIAMAAKAYFEDGKNVFFASLEMEGARLAAKWDALAAQVSYRALKRMEIGEGDLEKWYRAGERAADAKFEKDIIVVDDQYRPTADWVYGQVERHRCDLNVVDPIDEIRAPAHCKSLYEQVTWAAREIKSIARSTRRPIVTMVQAGRDAEEVGAKLGNVAGSIDVHRKCDVALGLHQTPQMLAVKQMEVRALKIRDDEGKGQSFRYFWDVDNLDFRPWKTSDAVPEKG